MTHTEASPTDPQGESNRARARHFAETAHLTRRVELLELSLLRTQETLQKCRSELGDCKFKLKTARDRNAALKLRLETAHADFGRVTGSLWWRVTTPARRIGRLLSRDG